MAASISAATASAMCRRRCAPISTRQSSLELTVLRPAPVDTPTGLVLRLHIRGTVDAQLDAGDGLPPGLGNRLVALGAMPEALARGLRAGLEPRQFVGNRGFDLFAHRAVARPSAGHDPLLSAAWPMLARGPRRSTPRLSGAARRRRAGRGASRPAPRRWGGRSR